MGFKLAPSFHPLGDIVLPIFGAGSDWVDTIAALLCTSVLHHFMFKTMSSDGSGSDVALAWPERILFMFAALVSATCFTSFAYRRPRKRIFWSMTLSQLLSCVVSPVYSSRKHPWLGLLTDVLMGTSTIMLVRTIVPSAETIQRWRRKSGDSKGVEDKEKQESAETEKPNRTEGLESKRHI